MSTAGPSEGDPTGVGADDVPGLARVRVVLVGTTHPGNIGATARAMLTMGLTDLALVNPARFPDSEAVSRASGALSVLDAAGVYSTLHEALADRQLVFATSARRRRLAWPEVDPEGCAAQVRAAGDGTRAAIVFGREHSGLTNEELAHCDALVHIPANPSFASLNVASAVQLVAYELRKAFVGAERPPAVESDREPLAQKADLEALLSDLEQRLIATDFLDPAHPRQLLRRVRRLCARARLTTTEVNILRGIIVHLNRN